MIEVDRPSPATRLLDRGLRGWSAVRRHPPAFDVHQLLLAARRRAGLDDFGEPTFRAGLDRLVASLDDEADLHPLGRRAWRTALVSLLAERLAVRDALKKGTVGSVSLVGPPVVVAGVDSPRVAAQLARRPGFELVGDDAHGDADLLAISFMSVRFTGSAAVMGYDEWLLAAEQAAAYQLHRLQLERRPGAAARPVMGALDHYWNLDAVRAAYPDSSLVLLCGDPSVPTASDVGDRWSRSADHVDAALLEAWWHRRWQVGHERARHGRECWPSARVHEVDLATIAADPAEMDRLAASLVV